MKIYNTSTRLWNDLPNEFKFIDKLVNFKKGVKTHIWNVIKEKESNLFM